VQIEVSKLVVSKENPRKTKASQMAHDALVASIKHHGLIQPLVVRPSADNDNLFEVIDGGRRFAAIKDAGLEKVEVIVNEAEFGIAEIGTAANMMRAAMHPLDEAQVIARLVADGEDLEDVAGRFGQTPKWASQRIKLDGLSTKAKKAFRDGTFGIATAEALTLGTKADQDRILSEAKDEWHLKPSYILRQFTNGKINANVAIFPLDQYPEKYIDRDLFSDDLWLNNRQLFDELQTKAAQALVEQIKGEGWSDVLFLMNGYDGAIMNKYVRVEGHIKKADRSKYVSVVVFTPGSGAVSVDRGLVLRKAAGKVKVGAETGADVVDPEDVKPLTCFDLSDTQRNIAGAMATSALMDAITSGDVYLAYRTICEGLLHKPGDATAPWVGIRPCRPSFFNVNSMMTDKFPDIEPPHLKKFPSREAFLKLTHEERAAMICDAALNAMQIMTQPSPEALKELKEISADWFRWDEGFLRRYRLDALQDLARRLKIEHEDVKKKDLIAAILAYEGDRSVVPVK
jgi:ParB/RepB/Spo0J family partition protein